MEVELPIISIFKKFISLIILTILIFPTANLAAAGQRSKLNSLRHQINTNKQKVNSNNNTKSKLNTEIKQADNDLREIQTRLDKLQTELNSARGRMRNIQSQLDKLTRDLEQKQRELESAKEELTRLTGVLNLRAQNYYKSGNVSYLEVLLSAKSFADLIHRADYLTRIVNQDAQLLKQIKETKSAIEIAKEAIISNKTDIEAKNASLVKQERSLADLAAQEQAQKDSMTAQMNSKKNLLSGIGDEQARLEDSIASEERDATRLEEIITSSPSQGRVIPIGSPSAAGFIWPVHGIITGHFGETRPGHMHAGIDIAVGTGTPVLASKGGIVDYAGWMSGYGYVVDINHGGGVTTRYAHNSRLLVSSGQAVAQGQQIASSGSTGRSTGPHVHFEIRTNGSPVNPLNYLP